MRSILILFFISASSSIAQLVYVESQVQVWLTEGSSMHVEGDVQIEGLVGNDGQLSLTGDWSNNNLYNSGVGDLIFVGNSAQSMDNNNQPVYRLVLDKSGDLTINGSLLVQGELSMQNGYLLAGDADTLLVAEEGTVDGGSGNSYVVGKMYYAGNGYRFFPIGDEQVFMPLELTDVAGVNLVLGVEAFQPNPDTLFDPGVREVSRVRKWDIDAVEGTLLGSEVILPLYEDEGLTSEEIVGAVVVFKPEDDSLFYDRGRSDLEGDETGGFVTSRDSVTTGSVAIGITNEYLVEGEIVIPTAFSPNAIKEIDRTLNIFANNVQEDDFLFQIFDRWGQKVFETSSFILMNEIGWDGINQNTGNMCPIGTYSYIMRAVFLDGEVEEATGSITLFK